MEDEEKNPSAEVEAGGKPESLKIGVEMEKRTLINGNSPLPCLIARGFVVVA